MLDSNVIMKKQFEYLCDNISLVVYKKPMVKLHTLNHTLFHPIVLQFLVKYVPPKTILLDGQITWRLFTPFLHYSVPKWNQEYQDEGRWQICYFFVDMMNHLWIELQRSNTIHWKYLLNELQRVKQTDLRSLKT